MRISLMGGAEVDLASTEEMSGLFDEAVGKITEAIPKRRRKPLLRRIPAAIQFPAVGPAVLSFQGPPVGYTWEITHALIVGSDASTVVANANAALYIGNTTSYGVANLASIGAAVPQSVNFGGGVMFAQQGDEVFYSVSGAVAAGSGLIGVLTVLQHVEELFTAGAM